MELQARVRTHASTDPWSHDDHAYSEQLEPIWLAEPEPKPPNKGTMLFGAVGFGSIGTLPGAMMLGSSPAKRALVGAAGLAVGAVAGALIGGWDGKAESLR